MITHIVSLIVLSCSMLVHAEEASITLYSPVNNLVTVKNKVLLKGKVAPASTLTINGESVRLNDNGRFFLKKE